MTKQELYEKLGGIYGGQKDFIDDVVNAFDKLKKQNDALINALTLTRQKYKNNKAKYKRKAKMYRDRNNKAIEYINKHSFFVDDTGHNKIIGYPIETYNSQDILDVLKGEDNE